MKSKIIRGFILTIVCLGCFCANKAYADSCDCSISSFENQFEKVCNDKFYVKPGTVFVSSQGIFICIQGQPFPVTQLGCDDSGVFIQSNDFKWGTCPACGWPLTPWGTCPNSDCATKG